MNLGFSSPVTKVRYCKNLQVRLCLVLRCAWADPVQSSWFHQGRAGFRLTSWMASQLHLKTPGHECRHVISTFTFPWVGFHWRGGGTNQMSPFRLWDSVSQLLCLARAVSLTGSVIGLSRLPPGRGPQTQEKMEGNLQLGSSTWDSPGCFNEAFLETELTPPEATSGL